MPVPAPPSTDGSRSAWAVAILSAMLLAPCGTPASAAEKFEKAAIFLEQNLQDQDAEVKIEVVGGGSGFAALKVTAPDGRVVVDFKAPDSKLGIRHLTLESPEPRNDGRLQADFPEGVYGFAATTTNGEVLRTEATLTHRFPAVAAVSRPRADEKNLAVTGLRVTWAAMKDIHAITVVIEDEESGRDIRATLAGGATGFAVPDGFLTGGTTYKLAVGAVARSGNKSVTETSFTTAARK